MNFSIFFFVLFSCFEYRIAVYCESTEMQQRQLSSVFLHNCSWSIQKRREKKKKKQSAYCSPSRWIEGPHVPDIFQWEIPCIFLSFAFFLLLLTDSLNYNKFVPTARTKKIYGIIEQTPPKKNNKNREKNLSHIYRAEHNKKWRIRKKHVQKL